MKEAELRAAATCHVCKRKIGETRLPLLYRVHIERHILNMAALQRQQGLGMMIGGMLASVMGPDEDMTTMIHQCTVTVCEPCSTQSICVAQLAEADKSIADAELVS